MNKMKDIGIEKITLNMGVGQAGDMLDKAHSLMKKITGTKAALTRTMKRNPTWGLRPKLTIGTKATLRGEKARELIIRLLKSKDNKILPTSFDNEGNLAFGISEYIDIPEVEYESDVGIRGLEVNITLERAGFRVKRRRLKRRKIPLRHRINKEEAQEFMIKNFNVKLEKDE